MISIPTLSALPISNQTMLIMNDGDGTCRNATDTSMFIDDNGMGSALGDYDNDGPGLVRL
jgi:hypothetical protein